MKASLPDRPSPKRRRPLHARIAPSGPKRRRPVAEMIHPEQQDTARPPLSQSAPKPVSAMIKATEGAAPPPPTGVTAHQWPPQRGPPSPLPTFIKFADLKAAGIVANHCALDAQALEPAMTMPMSVTAERTQWAIRISAAWQKSVDSIIETGRLLLAAKADPKMQHGEWGTMVESDLPFNRHTAHKLMQIAGDKRLTNVSQGKHLPPSWTTLYELTKLDDATFDQKLRDGSINPEMQRKDVARANRILNRERDRQRVENLPPIRGSAKTGKQVSSKPCRRKKADQAPALDPQAWSMSSSQEREAFVTAVGRSEIEDAFNVIESGCTLTRGLNTLNQAWNTATESDRREFFRKHFPANVLNRYQT